MFKKYPGRDSLPRQNGTINETLSFFKILPLATNTPTPENFLLVKAPLLI